MINFIDINTGNIFNGEQPYCFWFDEGQSVRLNYVKPICVITNTQSITIKMKNEGVFGLIDITKVDLNKDIEINSFTYKDLNDLLIKPTNNYLTQTIEGYEYEHYYIYLIYVYANSLDAGSYQQTLIINDQEFLIGADFYNENEILKSNVQNFGLDLPDVVQKAIYDSDIHEEARDNILMNRKFKELLIKLKDIIASKGSYKSLLDSLHWFEYGDMVEIQEYWRNNSFDNILNRKDLSPLITNELYNILNSYAKTTYIGLYLALNKAKRDELGNIEYKKSDNNRVIQIGGDSYITKLTTLPEPVPVLENIATKFSKEILSLKMAMLGSFYATYFMPIHLDLLHSTVEHIVFSNTIKIQNFNRIKRDDWFDMLDSFSCNLKPINKFYLENNRIGVNRDTVLGNYYKDGDDYGIQLYGVDKLENITDIESDEELRSFWVQLYYGICTVVPVECKLKVDSKYDLLQAVEIAYNNHIMKLEKLVIPDENGIIDLKFNIIFTKATQENCLDNIGINLILNNSKNYLRRFKFNISDKSSQDISIYKLKKLTTDEFNKVYYDGENLNWNLYSFDNNPSVVSAETQYEDLARTWYTQFATAKDAAANVGLTKECEAILIPNEKKLANLFRFLGIKYSQKETDQIFNPDYSLTENYKLMRDTLIKNIYIIPTDNNGKLDMYKKINIESEISNRNNSYFMDLLVRPNMNNYYMGSQEVRTYLFYLEKGYNTEFETYNIIKQDDYELYKLGEIWNCSFNLKGDFNKPDYKFIYNSEKPLKKLYIKLDNQEIIVDNIEWSDEDLKAKEITINIPRFEFVEGDNIYIELYSYDDLYIKENYILDHDSVDNLVHKKFTLPKKVYAYGVTPDGEEGYQNVLDAINFEYPIPEIPVQKFSFRSASPMVFSMPATLNSNYMDEELDFKTGKKIYDSATKKEHLEYTATNYQVIVNRWKSQSNVWSKPTEPRFYINQLMHFETIEGKLIHEITIVYSSSKYNGLNSKFQAGIEMIDNNIVDDGVNFVHNSNARTLTFTLTNPSSHVYLSPDKQLRPSKIIVTLTDSAPQYEPGYLIQYDATGETFETELLFDKNTHIYSISQEALLAGQYSFQIRIGETIYGFDAMDDATSTPGYTNENNKIVFDIPYTTNVNITYKDKITLIGEGLEKFEPTPVGNVIGISDDTLMDLLEDYHYLKIYNLIPGQYIFNVKIGETIYGFDAVDETVSTPGYKNIDNDIQFDLPITTDVIIDIFNGVITLTAKDLDKFKPVPEAYVVGLNDEALEDNKMDRNIDVYTKDYILDAGEYEFNIKYDDVEYGIDNIDDVNSTLGYDTMGGKITFILPIDTTVHFKFQNKTITIVADNVDMFGLPPVPYLLGMNELGDVDENAFIYEQVGFYDTYVKKFVDLTPGHYKFKIKFKDKYYNYDDIDVKESTPGYEKIGTDYIHFNFHAKKSVISIKLNLKTDKIELKAEANGMLNFDPIEPPVEPYDGYVLGINGEEEIIHNKMRYKEIDKTYTKLVTVAAGYHRFKVKIGPDYYGYSEMDFEQSTPGFGLNTTNYVEFIVRGTTDINIVFNGQKIILTANRVENFEPIIPTYVCGLNKFGLTEKNQLIYNGKYLTSTQELYPGYYQCYIKQGDEIFNYNNINKILSLPGYEKGDNDNVKFFMPMLADVYVSLHLGQIILGAESIDKFGPIEPPKPPLPPDEIIYKESLKFIPQFHKLVLLGDNFKVKDNDILCFVPDFYHTLPMADSVRWNLINLTTHNIITPRFKSLDIAHTLEPFALPYEPVELEPGYYSVELNYTLGVTPMKKIMNSCFIIEKNNTLLDDLRDKYSNEHKGN